MSKIKIDKIQAQSELSLLNQAESSSINGGSSVNLVDLVDLNVGIIIDPDIIINPQVAVGFGGGSASNDAGNGILNGNGIGQFNF